jgi:hypothetical protein
MEQFLGVKLPVRTLSCPGVLIMIWCRLVMMRVRVRMAVMMRDSDQIDVA